MQISENFQQTCRNGEKGFSIIEVLIAIAIFAIGGTAIIHMQMTAMQGTSSALGITEASFAHSSEIERLLGLDYSHADLAPGDHQKPFESATLTFINSYKVNFIQTPGSAGGGFKEIFLTTNWTKGVKAQKIEGQFLKLN